MQDQFDSPQRQAENEVRADLTHRGHSKIPALTGIRGYAACWVVLFHAGFLGAEHMGGTGFDRVPVIRSGYLGVDLFFLLSGFVLYLTYSQQMYLLSIRGLRGFYIGRMFRILPLHWFIIACYIALSPLLGGYSPFVSNSGFGGFLAVLLLVQMPLHLGSAWNPPSWSLSAEWLAYAIFPVLVLIVSRIRSRHLALAGITLGFLFLAAICALSKQPDLNHTQRLGLLRCMAEFPAGMLLCKFAQLRPIGASASRQMLVVGAVCLALALFDRRLDVIALPAFSLMILSCAGNAPFSRRVFGNRIALGLGEISFSIYMLHVLIIQLALARIPFVIGSRQLLFILACAGILTIILGWITWKLIEIPAQARGRIIARRKQD